MAILALTLASAETLSLNSTTKLCPSPGGWHPCACIHEVESGTRAEEVGHADGSSSLRLHAPDGRVRTLPHCAEKPPAPPAAQAAPPTDPCELGWAHAAPMEAFFQHSKQIATFSATYSVPTPPATTSKNILYWWIGLQPPHGSPLNRVIQPVLSYVPGSSPNNWYIESWDCCPAGHKVKAQSVSVKGPGAKLHGSMTRSDDGIFTITSTDGAGASSVLLSDYTNAAIIGNWTWVDIVLETYDVADCAQYASGVVDFSDMALVDVEGAAVTPSWVSAPYINGEYLPQATSAAFTACCRGVFDFSKWPLATMSQNTG